MTRHLPFAQAVEMALSGEIVHAASVALILAIDLRGRRRLLPEAVCELLQAL